jgi:very-short-patch-repair endonuclease
MGITHADRIEQALDEARQACPDLDGFFDADRSDRFFVKNLERVQGDERDAIILSIGYGKDAAGRLSYRFGPLLMQGGERRLNVAITRARRRLTLVSSFSHADLRADYPREGVRLLRAYIEYAASGGTRLDSVTPTTVPLNDFEQSVCDELRRQGLHVIPQLGASRYRIDLVVTHPERPGHYLLAVECDGASYHAAPTARERDRLRQQHLEALGWRFHRIWSTDWFLRRDEEVARLLAAYRTARDAAEAPAAEVPASAPPPAAAASAEDHAEATDAASAPAMRGPRPNVAVGLAITEYAPHDLEAVVRWVLSDGRLLTHDEIVSEVVAALGFTRRGTRIVAAIEQAIEAVKTR